MQPATAAAASVACQNLSAESSGPFPIQAKRESPQFVSPQKTEAPHVICWQTCSYVSGLFMQRLCQKPAENGSILLHPADPAEERRPEVRAETQRAAEELIMQLSLPLSATTHSYTQLHSVQRMNLLSCGDLHIMCPRCS